MRSYSRGFFILCEKYVQKNVYFSKYSKISQKKKNYLQFFENIVKIQYFYLLNTQSIEKN